MATQRNYHDQVIVDNNLKLRELLKKSSGVLWGVF